MRAGGLVEMCTWEDGYTHMPLALAFYIDQWYNSREEGGTMYKAEEVFVANAAKQRWKVHRKGWPDYVVTRDNGRISLVEVKDATYARYGLSAKLSKEQVELEKLLKVEGLEFLVCLNGNLKLTYTYDEYRKLTAIDLERLCKLSGREPWRPQR
jgi:hypothetical protein